MAFSVQPLFPFFPDRVGQPLDGYLYVGSANQNPETNPITVYWDAVASVTATQPLRVSGGLIYRNGTPARLFVTQSCSMTLRELNGTLVYSIANSSESSSGVSTLNADFIDELTPGHGVDMLCQLNTAQGADIVAAPTINLEDATGNVVDVTGNTGITAVTLGQGHQRLVRFTGTPTLTNGANLELPGGANITVAVGDYALFVGYASSVVRVPFYWQASRQPGAIAYLNVEDQALTGGVVVTSKSLGTITSGTVTPDPGDRPLQHYTNNGAHTLAPSANAGTVVVDITNAASAGAITTSGFTLVTGAFTTTNTNKFRCFISIGIGGSLLQIQALQ